MQPNQTIDLNPSAAMIIQSLRSVGYTLETAIADIIDNAITAKANHISIDYRWCENGDSYVIISDDGHGMSQIELSEAMKLGGHLTAAEDTLGRFGFGLKTASISQCRKLTVLSKKDNCLHACIWDLDKAIENNTWDASLLSNDQINNDTFATEILSSTLYNSSQDGTTIIWQNIDAGYARKREDFLHAFQKTKEHISLVFHRYLVKENNHPAILMEMNGVKIPPFHPFGPENNLNRISLQQDSIKCENHIVTFTPYILPKSENYSNIKEYEYHAGADGYIQNQGFYVYRNRRLIQHGTWFRLQRKAERTQLLRIQVDFPSELDSEWKVNIMKSQIIPPRTVTSFIKNLLECCSPIAEQQLLGVHYGQKRIGYHTKDKDRLILPVFDDKAETMVYKINTQSSTYTKLLNSPHLPEDYQAELRAFLNELSKEIEKLVTFNNPKPNNLSISEEQQELINTAKALKHDGKSDEEIIYIISHISNLTRDDIANFVLNNI